MKKILAIIFALCMVLSLPVMAEEADTESDEMEKGTRMNPYSFDEEVPLGMTYRDDEDYFDMTLKFTEIIDPDTLAELVSDEDWGENRQFAVRCEVNIGEGYTDDENMYKDTYTRFLTDEMDEQWCDWLIYGTNESFSSVYTYMDYDVILLCEDEDSYDLTQKYIRIGYFDNLEDAENNDYNKMVWIEIP